MSNRNKNLEISEGSSKSDSAKNTTFVERSRHVFSSIDELGKLKPESSLYQDRKKPASHSTDSNSRTNRQNETEDFRNRESIFKLSEREESGWPPSSKFKPRSGQWERGRDQDSDFCNKPGRQSFKRPFNRQKLPDHAKNPSKYTKYTLSDAPNISDRSNTQTALAFLKELSDRKDPEPNLKEEGDQEINKIMFKRPKRNTGIERDSIVSDIKEPAPCAITKRILPEAVVGQSSSFTKSSKKMLKKASLEKTLTNTECKANKKDTKVKTTLSHLTYDDEDS